MFCTNCGTKRQVASVFCAQCGKKFELEINETAQDSQNDPPHITVNPSQGKSFLTRNYESVESKMGGRLHLKFETCKILAERQELEIKGSAKAESGFSSTSGMNGTINSIQGGSYFSLEIGSTTTYSYWVKWENGIEELMQLPMQCRPGQSLIWIFARREYPDKKEKLDCLQTKYDGRTGSWPFFYVLGKEQVQDPNWPFCHVCTLNFETRAQHSHVRDFVLQNVHPAVKKWYDMPVLKLFGRKVRNDEVRLGVVDIVEKAVTDTEQLVKTMADAAVLACLR